MKSNSSLLNNSLDSFGNHNLEPKSDNIIGQEPSISLLDKLISFLKTGLQEQENIAETLINKYEEENIVSSLKECIADLNTRLKDLESGIQGFHDELLNLDRVLSETRTKGEKFLANKEALKAAKAKLADIIVSSNLIINDSNYFSFIGNLREITAKARDVLEANDVISVDTLNGYICTLEDEIQNVHTIFEQSERDFYDSHKVKRSIPEIWDNDSGIMLSAEEFFSRPEHEIMNWRRIFQESISLGERRFICPNCRQMVKISGRKYMRGTVSFFAHLHDSDYCEFKTSTGLNRRQIEARRYGLVAESYRHIRLKNLISHFLSSTTSQEKGVWNVEVEKRIDSYFPGLNWRRPDVSAEFNGMHIIFELQLSTTFISVVVERDIFYRLNNHFIVWVFNFDDNEKYVDLTNLMIKDIYYANKRR